MSSSNNFSITTDEREATVPYRQKVMILSDRPYGNNRRVTYRTWDSEMRYKLCYIQVLPFELQKHRGTDAILHNENNGKVNQYLLLRTHIIFSGSEASHSKWFSLSPSLSSGQVDF